MTVLEMNLYKRKLVAQAWNREKKRICRGQGTFDWSSFQQKSIIYYGKNIEFVAQFLKEPTTCNEQQVQFLDCLCDYLCAHNKIVKKNTIFGFYDSDNDVMKQCLIVPLTKLSEPDYLDYDKSHKYLFVGEPNQFGIKRKVAFNEDNRDLASLFGITATDSKKICTGKADRKNKFGF